MALNFKPLRCPWCQQPMDKRLLRQHQLLQPFLKRKPFPCPHCQKSVLYPEQADTVVSIGIFICAILTPLFRLWNIDFIATEHLFSLGLAIIITGICTQKLVKAGQPNE